MTDNGSVSGVISAGRRIAVTKGNALFIVSRFYPIAVAPGIGPWSYFPSSPQTAPLELGEGQRAPECAEFVSALVQLAIQ